MKPVDRQQREDAEVGDEYCPVEPGELMDSREGVVEKPRVNRPIVNATSSDGKAGKECISV